MEERFEELLESAKDLDFMQAMTMLNAEVYDAWEKMRIKKSNVTAVMTATTKKVSDYLIARAITIYKENIVYETKLREMEKNNKNMEDLASKLARTSVGTEEPQSRKDTGVRGEDFTVIVSTRDKAMDIQEVKKEVRRICKENTDLEPPRDVIVTKAGQVILKMGTRDDSEAALSTIMESDMLKEKIAVTVSRKRRERILLLSVDSAIEESEVVESMKRTLVNMRTNEGTLGHIRKKLMDPSLSAAARSVLEEMVDRDYGSFEIVKGIKTRNGKINWLIDVDSRSKEMLLQMKRVCIDYDRYRVVEFISINRCFKCQVFGHIASKCSGDIHCVKCSGPHGQSECKSVETTCYNCYFSKTGSDANHRADSPECPIYQAYREKLLAKRL